MQSHSEFNNKSSKKIIFVNEITLTKLTNEDVKKLFLETRGKINRCRRNKKDSRQLELDMCYIQREIQNRRMFSSFR